MSKPSEILSEVAGYYSGKLAAHGTSPRGVDWNGEEGQLLRFAQLCKVIDSPDRFLINDLGCGYGALVDYLHTKFTSFSYMGNDVSKDMVDAAAKKFADRSCVKFVHAAEPPEIADFGIASGIFNVRLGRSDGEWFQYLESVLDTLNRTSRVGFSFNCLTSYSDSDRKRDYLYYADPCAIFDLCKRKYSRNVALMHDYGLYEFTILVRKQV